MSIIDENHTFIKFINNVSITNKKSPIYDLEYDNIKLKLNITNIRDKLLLELIELNKDLLEQLNMKNDIKTCNNI